MDLAEQNSVQLKLTKESPLWPQLLKGQNNFILRVNCYPADTMHSNQIMLSTG